MSHVQEALRLYHQVQAMALGQQAFDNQTPADDEPTDAEVRGEAKARGAELMINALKDGAFDRQLPTCTNGDGYEVHEDQPAATLVWWSMNLANSPALCAAMRAALAGDTTGATVHLVKLAHTLAEQYADDNADARGLL